MKETWLTPLYEVWQRMYPDALVPAGQLARYSKPLVEKHGVEAVVRSLTRYLEATQPQFVSLHRWSATFRVSKPQTGPRLETVEQYAARTGNR